MNQTWHVGSHQWWVRDFGVSDAEGCKVHGSEERKFCIHGILPICEFFNWRPKLGTLVHMGRHIRMLYEKLTLGAHCTYRARAPNLHLFFLSRLQEEPLDGHGSNFVG